MSVQRARVATQGLIDKGKFDVVEEKKDDRIQTDREIIIDLLLHDPEVRELLKKIVAEISPEQDIRVVQLQTSRFRSGLSYTRHF